MPIEMAAYDNFQPCFFESECEDEFYDAPAPSEDIWKKFELLPTPPRSPKHDSSEDDDYLDYVAGLSEEDLISQTMLFPELGLHTLDETFENLKSKLIQDCMWSGKSGIWSKDNPKNESSPKDNVISSMATAALDIPNDCVDPAAVFPYPVSATSKDTPPGNETPSDSEDDDDDEEEIDVVSVESKPSYQLPSRRKPTVKEQTQSSMCAQVAAMHNYTQPHYSAPSTPNPSHCHTYSSTHGHKRSKASSSPASPQPPSKKHKSSYNDTELRKVVQKLKMSNGHRSSPNSRSSSDSEDCESGKRAQHNVLERKRRNDLKYSFLRLRDEVPDLSGNEKAAKVVILRKATDFINSLNDKQDSLSSELDHQKKVHEQLKRRLSQLRHC